MKNKNSALCKLQAGENPRRGKKREDDRTERRPEKGGHMDDGVTQNLRHAYLTKTQKLKL